MKTSAIVAMAALCALAIPAVATDGEVAQLLAAMAFVADSCPDMVVDTHGLHAALEADGYDARDGAATANVMRMARSYQRAYYVDPDRKLELCRTTWRAYGPDGTTRRGIFERPTGRPGEPAA